MRRFELSEGGSNKFWEIGVEGAEYTVRFGKIGAKGQTQTKSFGTPEAANQAAAKMVAEKGAKGYVEVGAAPAAIATPAAAPAASAAPASAHDKKRVDRVLKKAKAAETSSWDILRLALDGDAPNAPRRAAELLQGLFAKGRLSYEHGDALDAFGMLFHDAATLRRYAKIADAKSGGDESAPIDLLDLDLVVRLLTNATFACQGLEALALVAYRRDPARFSSARATFGPTGKALLDAARLRAGEALEGSDLDAAVRVLVHASIPLLLTTDGHVAQVTRADVEKATSQVPDAVWTTAYAEHYAGRGAYDAPNLQRLFAERRFDEDQLVRVALGPQNHLNDETTFAAFLELEVRAEPLFAALARWRDASRWTWAGENDAARTLLACLGARACARDGREVPAAFDEHFGPIELGIPLLTQRTIPGYPSFVFDTLRALPPARAAALATNALAKGDERTARGQYSYYDSDAILAAFASGDEAARARVADRIAKAPIAVRMLAGAAAT